MSKLYDIICMWSNLIVDPAYQCCVSSLTGGYHMRTSSVLNGKSSATLMSPFFQYENISCVQFYFSMQSATKNHWSSLTVSRQDLTDPPQDSKVIWRMRSLSDDVWHLAMQTIAEGYFRLIFEINGDHVRTSIDDVIVLDGQCSPESVSKLFCMSII